MTLLEEQCYYHCRGRTPTRETPLGSSALQLFLDLRIGTKIAPGSGTQTKYHLLLTERYQIQQNTTVKASAQPQRYNWSGLYSICKTHGTWNIKYLKLHISCTDRPPSGQSPVYLLCYFLLKTDLSPFSVVTPPVPTYTETSKWTLEIFMILPWI